MNKSEFLRELESHLQILEDQEQQDILEEYTQHIDMKIQKGLSEEEAIRDFGSVRDLAAGILEAYHVKPEFEQKKVAKSTGLSEVKSRSREVCSLTGRFIKRGVCRIGHGISRGWSWLQGKFRVFGLWLAGPFKRKKAQEYTGEEAMEKGGGDRGEADKREGVKRKSESGSRPNAWYITGRFLRKAAAGCVNLFRWCLRFLWNCFWLGASFLAAVFTMAVLFGFGTLVVLLTQGYPLKGIALMGFGGILCGAAIAAGCFSLILRRKRQEAAEIPESEELAEMRGETEYETVS